MLSADEIYGQVRELAEALDALHATGSLSISRDATNSEWADIDDAVRAARTALEVAAQALAWIDTNPATS